MQCLLFFLVAFLQICAAGPFSVRLTGGPSLCIGRVEVFHRGKWGTVCDDDWDMLDVAVVCRELDCGEAVSAPHGAWFGEGTGPIWLNEVRCQGTERHLHACRHKGFRRHVCTHEEDASATCSAVQHFPPFTAFSPPPTVTEDKTEAVMTTRAASSVPAEDEMPLTMVEEHLETLAIPVAPQRPQPIPPRRHSTLPTRGAETVAHEASWHSRKSSTGGHSEAILAGRWQVRLAGGSGSCSGRVEVLHKDSWGTVCDDGWDLLDAAVVCRELRCGAPLLSPGNARYGPGTGPIWLDDVNCTGKESSLQHCQSQPWEQHNCNHHEDASVICTGTWKPLSLPKPATDSSTADLILTTQGPNTVDESGLQNTLDVAEVPTPSLPPPWEMEFPSPWHPDELFLPPTHEMVLEVEKEEPTGPWNTQEITPGHEVLQNVHDIESPSPLKTRSPTHTHGPEPTEPSVGSQPLSAMWDLESERETEPTGTVMLKQGLKGAMEAEPFIQWDNMSRKPSVTQKAEPTSSSSAETQSASAIWVVEPVKEPEPTSFSGTELLPVIKDLKDTTVTVTKAQWHRTPGLPPVTQEPFAEIQPASAMWDLESERETDPPSSPGTVSFRQGFQDAVENIPSIQWDTTSQEPPVTQKADASSFSSETQPTVATWALESERETEPASFTGTELLPDTRLAMETVPQVQWDDTPRVPPVTREPTSTLAESQPASALWVWESESETESAIHGGMELFPPSESLETSQEPEMQTATRNVQPVNDREESSPIIADSKGDADPKQKEILDEDPHTVRSIDAASTPGPTKASGTSTPSAEPTISPAHLSDSPAGCPVRLEARNEPQDCCCSADSLGNMIHAMDGLRGELGSVSAAIRGQGSQLEAVARNLAELVTSVHRLVEVLPVLIQPVPASPPSVPCRQNEGKIQNRLSVQ